MVGKGKRFNGLKCAAVLLLAFVIGRAAGGEEGRSPYLGMARIEALSAEPGARPEVGTGFLIYQGPDGGYLTTAHHVVRGAATINVYFAVAPDASPSPARILAIDADLDLAVLLAAQLPARAESLPLQLDREPGLGEWLHLIGYSVNKRSPAVRNAALAQNEGADFLLQTEVDEMDSGSPVIFEGGIAGWIKSKDGQYARGSSAAVLAKALQGWQIPFSRTAQPSASAPAMPTSSMQVPQPAAPAFSCTARVVSEMGGSLQLYQGPSRDSPSAGSLADGTVVEILEQRFGDAGRWYRVATVGRRLSGYLPQTKLALAGNCSSRR